MDLGSISVYSFPPSLGVFFRYDVGHQRGGKSKVAVAFGGVILDFLEYTCSKLEILLVNTQFKFRNITAEQQEYIR